MNTSFVAAQVTADWLDRNYPCFHAGEDWNGWAVPYFDFPTAMFMCEDKENNLQYNEEKDAFVWTDENNEEPEEFTPVAILVDGVEVKTYPIGASIWCWDIVE